MAPTILDTIKETKAQQREIYGLFKFSVLLKGGLSVLEILGGLLFLIVPPQTVTALGVFLTQDELSEDPHNFIAQHVYQATQNYTHGMALFAAFYLIARGVIKLGLVAALLKNYIWAYPASLAVLGLFVLYQVTDFAIRHSPIVALITVFDLIVMYFIWREYRIVRLRATK